MYEATNKRRIYQLIDMYLSKKIDEETFCEDFVPSYGVELDYDTITREERKAFSELQTVASRFSPFEEDHKKNPYFFYTKEQLKAKIIETREKLTKYFEELKNQDKENSDNSF